MNDFALVLFYSLIVVASALLGGWVPLWAGSSQRRLEYFLAASAGVMIGIVGMHLLPESFGEAGTSAGWGVLAGFLFLLVIERFVLPHPMHSLHAAVESESDAKALSTEAEEERTRSRAASGGESGFRSTRTSKVISGRFPGTTSARLSGTPSGRSPGESSGESTGDRPISTSGPLSTATSSDASDRLHQRLHRTAGLGAYLGLSLHTVTDGVALGAAMEDRRVAFYVLLAIVLHKIPSAFALGSLLVKEGIRPAMVLAATGSLGLLVAVGAIGFRLATFLADFDAFALTPYAVAFSAGSFLHVAVTDLLPDLHRSGAAKVYLLLALFAGLGVSVLLGGIVPEP